MGIWLCGGGGRGVIGWLRARMGRRGEREWKKKESGGERRGGLYMRVSRGRQGGTLRVEEWRRQVRVMSDALAWGGAPLRRR